MMNIRERLRKEIDKYAAMRGGMAAGFNERLLEDALAEIEAVEHDIARAVQANTEALGEIERFREDAENYRWLQMKIDIGEAPTFLFTHITNADGNALDLSIRAARKGASHD